MNVYQRVWLFGWGTVSLIVIGFALLMRGPLVVVLSSVTALALSWLVVTAFSATSDPEVPRATRRRDMNVAAVAASVIVTVILLASMHVGAAALVLILAVGSSPPLVARLTRALRSSRDLSVESPAPLGLVASNPSTSRFEHMSDSELCRAWRASFAALLEAPGPEQRGAVVQLREQLLEELDRRYPDAVSVWLATTPRAADGPERFLPQSRSPGHDAA